MKSNLVDLIQLVCEHKEYHYRNARNEDNLADILYSCHIFSQSKLVNQKIHEGYKEAQENYGKAEHRLLFSIHFSLLHVYFSVKKRDLMDNLVKMAFSYNSFENIMIVCGL